MPKETEVSPTWWSPVILSNSSTQHTPRSASTSAPASKLNSPPSRTTLTCGNNDGGGGEVRLRGGAAQRTCPQLG